MKMKKYALTLILAFIAAQGAYAGDGVYGEQSL